MTLLDGVSKSIARSPRYHWWAYSALSIGVFLGVMDQSAVGIALPRIAEHFGSDLPTVQWISLGYILSIAAMIIPMGRLSDMLGRKTVYIAGLMIFVGAAAVGGSSNSLLMLVAAKVVQGVGAASVQANGMAMLTEAFPERERGKALGLYMTLIGTGSIIGPVVGGVLVGALDWRAVFFAAVPLGLLAMAAALAVLKGTAPAGETTPARRTRFDWTGAGLSSGALVSFLLAITNAHRFGWGSAPIAGGLATAAVMLVTFIWWQLRTRDPILDLTLFRNRAFSMGVSARFVSFLGGAAVYFIMPFYLIEVLGLSPTKAGVVLVPSSLCIAIASPISGRLSDSIGTRGLMVFGLGLSAAAMFTFATLTVGSSPARVMVGMVLSGLGWGAFTSPNNNLIMSTVEKGRYGIVTALLHLSRNTANVTGVALATTIVTMTMAAKGYEPSLGAVTDGANEGANTAFVTGVSRAFLLAGGLMLVAMALSWMRGKGHVGAPVATPAAARLHPPPATDADA